MTIEQIDTKIAALEVLFSRVQKEKEAADAELYRLQGEYRALNTMKAELEDPATTVKAEPAKAKA